MGTNTAAYEAPTVFHRVRSERRVHATAMVVALAMLAYTAHVPRQGWLDHLVLDGALVLLTLFSLREARALLRSRGAWAFRIAGVRAYLTLPDEPSERSFELCDLQHVMLAEYGAGNQRETKVFLLLRDGRCWEVPRELLFPRRPLVRAILRAAPHSTVVTNAQIPARDPLNSPTTPAAATTPS